MSEKRVIGKTVRALFRFGSGGPRRQAALGISLAALLCLLIPSEGRAAPRVPADTVFVIGNITVEGHQALSTRQILETVGVHSRESVGRAVVLDRLRRLLVRYRDLGYPRAEARVSWEPAPDGRTDLRLSIDEGPPYRVESVSLEGCGGVSCGSLSALLDTRTGSIFGSAVYRADLEGVLEAYANHGYPYARIETVPQWSEPAGIDLTLRIDEGPRVVLDDIRIEGNSSTRARVIERECGVRRGDLYVQRKIDRIEARLVRLGFFSGVETSVSLEDSSGRGVLDIRVEERKTNSLYGAVGYVPRGPEGYLTGILDVSFGNIAGTGRSAAARWRTYQPGAFEWTFSYGEPWILGVPLEAGLTLHQEVRDSTFTKTVGELGLEYPLSERFWARVAGLSEGVTAGSGGAGWVRGSRRRSADVSLRSDLRDDPLNPRRGWRSEIGLTYGRKDYDGGGSVRSATYHALGEILLPTARRQVLALTSSVRWLDTGERDIPEYEQFHVGGAESLRGYSEDAFFGWRVVTMGAEYRFLLGRRSRFHVFVDAGRLDRRLPVEGGTEDRTTWLTGYGFGLRSESRLGMVGVDFGFARGEPLTEGKIHLRLEGEF